MVSQEQKGKNEGIIPSSALTPNLWACCLSSAQAVVRGFWLERRCEIWGSGVVYGSFGQEGVPAERVWVDEAHRTYPRSSSTSFSWISYFSTTVPLDISTPRYQYPSISVPSISVRSSTLCFRPSTIGRTNPGQTARLFRLSNRSYKSLFFRHNALQFLPVANMPFKIRSQTRLRIALLIPKRTSLHSILVSKIGKCWNNFEQCESPRLSSFCERCI
jgi:hypothetical protein